MNTIYSAIIVVEGQTCRGKPLAVGSKVSGPEAWIHCLPGMRNSPPVAEPADQLTADKVQEELERRRKLHAGMVPKVQARVDALAAKLPTDEAGNFVRRADGTIPRATEAEQFDIDNAEAYGITPGAGVTMVETVANVTVSQLAELDNAGDETTVNVLAATPDPEAPAADTEPEPEVVEDVPADVPAAEAEPVEVAEVLEAVEAQPEAVEELPPEPETPAAAAELNDAAEPLISAAEDLEDEPVVINPGVIDHIDADESPEPVVEVATEDAPEVGDEITLSL